MNQKNQRLLMFLIAFLIALYMILDSDFIFQKIKVQIKDLHIEISGHEKSTHPLKD